MQELWLGSGALLAGHAAQKPLPIDALYRPVWHPEKQIYKKNSERNKLTAEFLGR